MHVFSTSKIWTILVKCVDLVVITTQVHHYSWTASSYLYSTEYIGVVLFDESLSKRHKNTLDVDHVHMTPTWTSFRWFWWSEPTSFWSTCNHSELYHVDEIISCATKIYSHHKEVMLEWIELHMTVASAAYTRDLLMCFKIFLSVCPSCNISIWETITDINVCPPTACL